MVKEGKFVLILTLFLVAWLSLLPESVQNTYRNFLRIILFLSLICLLKRLRSIKIFFVSREIFFWLFLGSGILSYIFAVNRTVAILQYYNMVITAILLFFLMKYLVNIKSFKWNFCHIVCWFSLIVVVMGILEFILHKNILYENFLFNPFYKKYIYEKRIMSTQMHPSVLGTYFLAVIPFSAFLTFNGRNFKERYLGFLSGLAGFLGIFLAFARAAFLGVFVFFTLYLWRKNKKTYSVFIVIMLLCFLLTIPLSEHILFLKRFNFILTFRHSVHKMQIDYRLERFPAAFKMWKQHPFTGVGIDNFRLLFDKYHPAQDVPFESKIPDNMYLTIFAETGLVGSICFLLFICQLLRQEWRALKVIVSREDQEFLFILLCGFIGLLVNMASYDLFYWYMPLYFFWIYAGAIRGLSLKSVS